MSKYDKNCDTALYTRIMPNTSTIFSTEHRSPTFMIFTITFHTRNDL